MNYEPLFTTYSQLSFVEPSTETNSHNGKSMKGIRQERYSSRQEHFDVIDDNDIEQVARDEQEEREKEILHRRSAEKLEAEKAKLEVEKAKLEEAKAKQALSELQGKQAELERRFADMEARQRAMPPPGAMMGGQGGPGGPPQMGGRKLASAEEFDVLKGQPGVQMLDPTNLAGIKAAIEGAPSSFVWFYAPWCGFCTRLIPTMVDVVKQMNGRIPIFLVNADNQPDIGRAFEIKGFPTLNAYKGNSGAPIVYNGDRSANDIVSFLNNQL